MTMNRVDVVNKYVSKDSKGLEIGPSHAPLAPKRYGYKVDVVDHLDAPGLRAKYISSDLNSDNIEEVDYIWNGGALTDVISKTNEYEWIIASHVIEHMPDILGFLQSLEKLITRTGRIVLAVPDKRNCFDYFRSVSSIREVLDAHFQKREIHTAGVAVDYFLNVVARDGHGTWTAGGVGHFNNIHCLQNARDSIIVVNEQRQYLDVHGWVFTPTSFRLIIKDLNDLGLLKIKEVECTGRIDHEFLIVLGFDGVTMEGDRISILKRIHSEIAEGIAMFT